MPIAPTYPGVYVEEIPSGVRTIIGVATSITAFIGRASRGPSHRAVRIQSFGDFQRIFGGLAVDSTMSYAVQQFFLNGGTDALIVRVTPEQHPAPPGQPPRPARPATEVASKATFEIPATGSATPFLLEAAGEGSWGDALRILVDHKTADTANKKLFNLRVEETAIQEGRTIVVGSETFRNISVDPDSSRYVKSVLDQQSFLVSVGSNAVPTASPNDSPEAGYLVKKKGIDGGQLAISDVIDDAYKATKKGLYALEEADLFNLLCIPPLVRTSNEPSNEINAAAITYCRQRRAMLIADPPSWGNVAAAVSGFNDFNSGMGADGINGAIFFPRLKMADPLLENRPAEFVPCGAMAGLFARTDAQRGVWKAPAGIEATLTGVNALTVKMTDPENGLLNPLGVNCLRTFPLVGHVSWGARTLRGADQLTSEWKYIPVRRTALFLEESLYRGLKFAVFEPNDEPLWAQIRLNVGAFMQNLFRQGAFQGRTPHEAYFVKCDKETTIQNDIDRGIVNVIVGFAPLKPAEFVMLKIQQMAGQIQS